MKEIVLEPNEKQKLFFESTAKYTAYGGARGGGKSWAMRIKLILLALNYEGIQILLLRRTLVELRENHLLPMLRLLDGIASYSASEKEFRFPNGSRIRLGYCDSENDVLQFQGQAYEVIGLEEATHFTEFQFLALTESNRASGYMKRRFAPRMYFTCNPGGVGHGWVKRRFVDREFRGGESPDDYLFIKSLVFDNKYIMENNPEYVDALMNLPETRRKAMLYGDWDAFEGAFFPEFDPLRHTVAGYFPPEGSIRFRALDYGLDMTCCLWCCVESDGSIVVYKELYESGLLLSEAAKKIADCTDESERIRYTVCSPDLWNRRQDSGRSGFDVMSENGLRRMIKADDQRIAGWRVVREYLCAGKSAGVPPKLRIDERCKNLIRCLPLLRFDEKKSEDAADTPHEITHAPEALRYALMSRYPKPSAKAAAFNGGYKSFPEAYRNVEGDYSEFLDY
ncbi:MAG: phage terminase large subunit [Clostridia bacterium]|nr:phage terminase large subunit [Clostridia bacterium]